MTIGLDDGLPQAPAGYHFHPDEWCPRRCSLRQLLRLLVALLSLVAGAAR